MKPCERYLNAINERVDGTLGPIRGAELDLHLEGCDACRALLADLQDIARAAGSLDVVEPPARAWAGIADRLRAEGRVAPAPARTGGRGYTMIALAAALVIAVGISLLLLFPRERGTTTTAGQQTPADVHPAPEGNAAGSDPVQSVASELALTEQHLQNAVEQATKTAEAVDPQTAAVLQKNLQVVNQAIAESRAALTTDPQSVPARRSLYEALRQKIQFLQDTIALMNEMREGDAAGAAEIVEGGKS